MNLAGIGSRDGPLFFANANPLRLGVLELVGTTSPPPRVVVLDLSSSFRLSVPTIDTLSELHDELGQRGIVLWLARIRSTAMAELQAHGLADRLGPASLHNDPADAVRAFASTNPPPAPPGQPHERPAQEVMRMASPSRGNALDHVVVVMFENRSFDQLLGCQGVRPDRSGPITAAPTVSCDLR